MDLELDIANPTPEEVELLENELYVIDHVSMATSFQNVGLFEGEQWKGVRYYLTQMNAWFTIGDIIDCREHIITDLSNLGVMNQEMINEFDRLIDVVVRSYHL